MFCHNNHLYNKAFSLIELMVSMSIIAIVSTVIVTKQSAFNGAVLLRNQAYEIAFTLREAQMLAVSGGDANTRSYGVYFDSSNTNQHTYRLFGDNNENGRYDSGEQIGVTGKLDKRFEVRDVSPNGGGTELVVLFIRPNFDARFCANGATCPSPTAFSGGTAYINVSKTGVTGNDIGDVRRVQITATGQISVITY